MKIINWNIGRPSNKKSGLIIEKLLAIDGDIIILTETKSAVHLPSNYNHLASTVLPQQFEGVDYSEGEHRSSIWTKYPIQKSYETFDHYTSICADVETPLGLLTIYATIIGVLGGKDHRFEEDMHRHFTDFERLFIGRNVCMAGDYNVSFSGYTYPSHKARQQLNGVFEKYSLRNLTAEIPDCVNHIAISTGCLKGVTVAFETWNFDKKLSDHIGTAVTFNIS